MVKKKALIFKFLDRFDVSARSERQKASDGKSLH